MVALTDIKEEALPKSPKRLKDFLTLSGLRLTDMASGILKDILLTKAFGLGVFMDAYFVTTSCLDMFSGYFQQMGYGILLPFYNEQATTNNTPEAIEREQEQIIVVFLNWLILSMGVIGILILVLYQTFGSLMAPNLMKETDSHLELLLMISLPLSILFQGSYALRIILVQKKRFAYFHLPGILSTLVFIGCLWAMLPQYGYWAVIWALPVSQIFQFVLYWYLLKIRWQLVLKAPFIRKMLLLSLPNTLSWLFFYLFVPIDNYFLTFLPPGDLSSYRFAMKMVTVFSMLTVFSLQMTMVPAIMTAGSQKDFLKMKKLIGKGFFESLLFGIPLIFAVILMAPFLIKLFFERGAFVARNTQQVVFCLQILIWQIPFIGSWMMISRSYNSLFLLKPFMWIGLGALCLRVLFDWWGLRIGGIQGVAWMTVFHYYLLLLIGVGYLLFRIHTLQRETVETAPP
jgi:putative peptidoglycan lipid II flippase